MSEQEKNTEQGVHKRRARYKGKYPRKFEEKYKELYKLCINVIKTGIINYSPEQLSGN